MPKATSEEAFEALIEQHLLDRGYLKRKPQDFNSEIALIEDDLTGYVQDTQPKIWKRLETLYGEQAGAQLIDSFDKEVQQRGLLAVLRKGFKASGRTVQIVTFRPAHGWNPDLAAEYKKNRVAVGRQIHVDPKRPGQEADLVLFVNGIPVVTIELKNPFTGQRAAHAKAQYQRDRDPEAPIFRFKERALVHFAVGSEEVWMTTRLNRADTHFLPFNKGDGHGAGNPSAKGKHRTHYLWEEVLERDSLIDILARFLFLEGKEKLIFPRYHQLDCVRLLVKKARDNGAGTNYLVQHSAGSGKSNSIAWLTHQLASLHDAQDQKVYDGVVVITDRQILDSQLQDVIFQIDHEPGVVQLIVKGKSKSGQLAEALAARKPIIVCTIQSFGALAEKLDALDDRRYAIVVDEAHSSQTGDTARDMKEILGASSIAERYEEEADDVDAPDQAVLRAALARGPQRNLSYFAFTATPKYKTLQLFGHRDIDGEPRPIHLYSMRQAIEEDFILDVLKGYTTYERYFELVKKVQDDPELDKKKASRALARFVDFHPENLRQKTEVIVEHFRSRVRRQLDGQAKAMVVTASRLHAVKTRLAFDRYIEEKGYRDLGVLVAFSGSVVDPEDPASAAKPWTEPEMNRDPATGKTLPETRLREAFDTDRYQILIVAEKYQTGFDQKKLMAMYVDRRLSGIQAVQTLSRLNRKKEGKERTFVLDFVNKREEILKSFQPYYESTTIEEDIDPHRLYELRNEILAFRILHESELVHFADVFFAAGGKDGKENARLYAALDPTVDRFNALDDDARDLFRDRLGAFLRLYSFLAQIVPFSDIDLERLYVFGKMLERKLPRDGEPGDDVTLGEDVALRYYRLQKQAEGAIEPVPGVEGQLPGPTETGTGSADPQPITLSSLIDQFNERFGTDFDTDNLVESVTQDLRADERMRAAAKANDRDNFALVHDRAFDKALIERLQHHKGFVNFLFENEDALNWLRRKVRDEVYDGFQEERRDQQDWEE